MYQNLRERIEEIVLQLVGVKSVVETKGEVAVSDKVYEIMSQMDYYKKIKQAGLHGKISIKDCIIADGIMYVFRNIKSKLWYEK